MAIEAEVGDIEFVEGRGAACDAVSGDLETFARRLKAEVDGEDRCRAGSGDSGEPWVTLGLIDEYRL